jgi:hypothetical protein
MTKRLFERLEEIPECDHASWGVPAGKLDIVERLWTELGWPVVHRIEANWGRAIFVASPGGVWFQFSDRADVTARQPGDHPAICVQGSVKDWANAIVEFLRNVGEDAVAIFEGANALIKSDSVGLMIEILPQE